MGAAVWICFGRVQAAKEQQGEDYEGFAKHWEEHTGSGVHFCCTAKGFELHPISPSKPQAFYSLMQGNTLLSMHSAAH